jgi:hypothetical protein
MLVKTESYIFLNIGAFFAQNFMFTQWRSPMKRLSKDLKRMLAGLAYQDAGDYLSTPEKISLLGCPDRQPAAASMQHLTEVNRPVTRYIALLSDGRGEDTQLEYAIEAAQRQQAQIDLLLHGCGNERRISNLERRLQQADIPYRSIWLVEPVVEDLLNYLVRQTSLIFLVAMSGDEMARVLLEEVIPKRGEHITVPMVMINEPGFPRSQKQSAA